MPRKRPGTWALPQWILSHGRTYTHKSKKKQQNKTHQKKHTTCTNTFNCQWRVPLDLLSGKHRDRNDSPENFKSYIVTHGKMFWFQCYPHKSVLLLQYPQKTVIVWVYPQKRVSLKKYPHMSEKGLGLPIYEIKPLFYDCCFEVDIRIRRYTIKRWIEQNTHEQWQFYVALEYIWCLFLASHCLCWLGLGQGGLPAVNQVPKWTTRWCKGKFVMTCKRNHPQQYESMWVEEQTDEYFGAFRIVAPQK